MIKPLSKWFMFVNGLYIVVIKGQINGNDREADGIWVWKYDGSELPLDLNEEVLFVTFCSVR